MIRPWSPWSVPCRPCYDKKRNIPFTKQMRSRYVIRDKAGGGKPCLDEKKGQELSSADGTITEEKVCKKDKDVPPCPKRHIPYWSAWEEWEECKVLNCRTTRGIRKRFRTCLNKTPRAKCRGRNHQNRGCTTFCEYQGKSQTFGQIGKKCNSFMHLS